MNNTKLISGPFSQCPQCNNLSLGTLFVDINCSKRGCSSCKFLFTEKLPKITKKIIYLDQFVISNLSLIASNNTRFERSGIKEFWLEVYKKIIYLTKLNLIICPFSYFHVEESLSAKEFEYLQLFYQSLSNWIRFKDHHTIIKEQITEHFNNYLNDKFDIPPEIGLSSGFKRDPNGWFIFWNDPKTLKLDQFPSKDELIIEIADTRDSAYLELQKTFDRWKNSKGEFNDLVWEEALSFGDEKLKMHFTYTNNVNSYVRGETKELMPMPPSFLLIKEMHDIVKRKNILDKKEIFKIIEEYFDHNSILKVPYIRLSTEYYASIARELYLGKKKLPSRGIFNDNEFISAFLPYCDAMFIDKEGEVLFSKKPLREEKNLYSTEIFSLSSKDSFISYLDKILAEASEDHINIVKKIYDNEWLESDKFAVWSL